MEDDPVRHLMLQFLTWIAEKPRSYGDVMDAWRTSCPRLPVWEDAVSQGLVKREQGPSLQRSMVCITRKGLALLRAAPARHAGAGNQKQVSRVRMPAGLS
jgi:hypothetical protein